MPRRFRRRVSLTQFLIAANVALVAAVAVLLATHPAATSWRAGSVLVAPAAASKPPGDGFVPKSSMTEVIHRVSPSVINVGGTRNTLVPNNDFFSPFLYRQSREVIPYLGSGFIIDREGHAITNFHVIDGAEQVMVTLSDGREFPADVLDKDPFVDLAMIRIKGDNLPPPIEFGEADDLQIGETVIALGNPFGNMMQDPRPTVTVGVVSALHRYFRPDPNAEKVYADMIQTDAAINPGNSGGPLIDAFGRLVGVNTFIFSRSGGSHGIGFAIPERRVRALVAEIKEHGRIRPLLRDFDLQTVRLQKGGTAALLTQVAEEGPSKEAGLRRGDLIVEIDGRRVSSAEEVLLTFASRMVDDTVALGILRDGERADVKYTIGEARRPQRR